MKKLFTVTLLAGLLSMPSVVFAEASWYGSLRSAVEAGGGSDARFVDGGSRWGIKGSAEASEGLTAVYRFEHKISTSNASQPGGRLAYVGLSGGFGTVTAGQIWSASFNSTGAITDNSMYYGNSETTYRHGNAVSYAVSAGAMSMQIDVLADSGMETGGAVDKTEFGLTVALGDIGKVAFAHTNMKNTQKVTPIENVPVQHWVDANNDTSDGDEAKATTIQVSYAGNQDAADVSASGVLTAQGLGKITSSGGVYILDGVNCANNAANDTAADDCKTATVYMTSTTTRTTNNAGDVTETTDENYYASGSMTGGGTTGGDTVVDAAGHKASHVAFETTLGGITAYVGHSTKKVNGATTKSKTTHFGVRGDMGDTGMSFRAMARNKKDGMGNSSTPWLVGFSRSLGGGAALHFEHGNNDDDTSGNTRIGLHVGF